jgi:hypothetical protein
VSLSSGRITMVYSAINFIGINLTASYILSLQAFIDFEDVNAIAQRAGGISHNEREAYRVACASER